MFKKGAQKNKHSINKSIINLQTIIKRSIGIDSGQRVGSSSPPLPPNKKKEEEMAPA